MSDTSKNADSAPKKSKKGLIIGLAAGVLLLGAGGGGGAWWFLANREVDEEAVAAREEARRIAARVFVTLDPFVVNLADRENERYAQVGVVLEVEGPDANKRITDKMPAVRNEILLLISSKSARELITREGKEALAAEIALAAARPLGWKPPPDEPEEPPAPAVKTKDGKSKDAKAKAKAAKPAEPPPPNPVARVHFASFIVQ